jgi:hypothetical protein
MVLDALFWIFQGAWEMIEEGGLRMVLLTIEWLGVYFFF